MKIVNSGFFLFQRKVNGEFFKIKNNYDAN